MRRQSPPFPRHKVMTGTRSSGLASSQFAVARSLRLAPVVAVVTVLAGVLAFLLSSSRADRYEATTIVQLNTVDLNSLFLDRELPRLDTYALIASGAALVDTPRVRAEASKALQGTPTASELAGRITVVPEPDSTLIRITVAGATPEEAARSADAVRQAFLETRAADAAGQLDVPIRQAREQIEALEGSGTSAARAKALESRVDQLEALRSISDAGAWNVQPAERPGAAVSPSPARDAVLGAILGFLLATALVIAVAYLDPRVRLTQELEEIWPLPVTAALPPIPRNADPRVDDAFGVALASLRLRHAQGGVHTVAVVSAAAGEGKTASVLGLAAAAARAGLRVLVVDTDIRRPELTQRCGITLPSAGLAELVTGASGVEDVLKSAVKRADGVPKNIAVLPPGTVGPGAFAAVVGAEGLPEALRRVSAGFDLVLLDTAPATSVGDAQLVAAAADEVLVVARIGGVTRRDFAVLRDRFVPLDANVAGAVIIGAVSPTQFSYGR